MMMSKLAQSVEWLSRSWSK